jgi:hypothetical protein
MHRPGLAARALMKTAVVAQACAGEAPRQLITRLVVSEVPAAHVYSATLQEPWIDIEVEKTSVL